MADTTTTNAATTTTASTTPTENLTTVQAYSTQTAGYDPILNGQEKMAAATVANAEHANAPLHNYDTALTGSEATAKQIVDASRDTNSATTPFSQTDMASALNNTAPAAGQPFNGAAANVNAATLNGTAIGAEAMTHNLEKPAAHHTTTVAVQPGEMLKAQFDPDSADLNMKGHDLVMSFHDGSKIILQHFADDTQNMPTIALPNGAIVAGGVIVAQLQGTTDIFNLQTAAGGAPTGGGQFIYSDDFGNVIGLLNKLPPIGFTSLTFPQPQPEDRPNALVPDNNGGSFTPHFDTIAGILGQVSGGFEDWAPFQNTGDNTQYPMALSIGFTPQDNEVVDKVTITNVPAGVTMYYGTTGSYALATPDAHGNYTFTAAQLANGTIFVKPVGNSDIDIPLTISLTIHDPDTSGTAVLTKNTVATIDSVADQPVLSSALSVLHPATDPNAPAGAIIGQDHNTVNLHVDGHFPDVDGSETHMITVSGIPAEWTLASSTADAGTPAFTITSQTASDGTVTYTIVTTDPNAAHTAVDIAGNLQFSTNNWDSSNGDAHITVTATATETITDGEITTVNNTSTVTQSYDVDIVDSVPKIEPSSTIGTPSTIAEHSLAIPGIDQVTGHIDASYGNDVPGNVKLTTNGLDALHLTSGGSNLTYTLSADGKTVTAIAHGDIIFTIALGAAVDTGKANANGEVFSNTYTYTLYHPLDNSGQTDGSVAHIPVQFTSTDSDGDSIGGSFQVNVVDDTPTAHDDTAAVANNTTTATGNVLTNDTLSVDTPDKVSGISHGATTMTFAANGQNDNTGHGQFMTIDGDYGTLKIYQDGTYTYTYHTVGNTGNLVDNFNYVMTDSDGDTSATSLTINITDNGTGVAPAIEATVDETTDISHVISNMIHVDDAATFALTGFTANGSEKGGALSSDGVPVTVSLVNGQYIGVAGNTTVFTMTIANDGTYTFVQKAPLDHADGTNPNDIINLVFNYKASDADGDSSSSTITIHVKDDAPIAVADTNSIPDGSSTASGNILTNDHLSVDKPNTLQSASFGGTTKSFATDGQTDANGKYVLINGQYGVLKVYENGQYTYTYDNAHNTGNHTETFGYALKDYDGDTSATTLTINITDKGTGTAPYIEATVDETTDINHVISSVIHVDNAASFALNSFTATGSEKGGALSSDGVPVTVSLVNGQYVGMAGNTTVFTISLANDGTYTFVQKAPLDHADGSNPNDIINLTFGYTAKDADGDSSSSTITIHVKDDAPIAVADTNNVPNNASTATGNVITNDHLSVDKPNTLQSASFGGTTKSFATDGQTDANGKYVLINGQYGQLKIYDNGQYTYTYDNAHNTGNHTETFGYTLKDYDGDTSATSLTINITDNGTGVAPAIEATVDETTDISHVISNMIHVDDAATFALTGFTANGSEKGGALSSDGVPVTVSLVNGQYIGVAGNTTVFTMTIANDGTYTFVQKAPLDHADGTNPNDIINLVFNYKASDADGDSSSSTITIHVKDDAPIAVADTNSIPDGSSTASGNILTNDHLSVDKPNTLQSASFGGTTKSFATDGQTDANGKYVLINGQYGVLKVYENGQYTYTYDNAHNTGNHTETFGYALKDYDGDTSATTLTINITDKGTGTAPYIEATVDETTDINHVISSVIHVDNAASFALNSFTATGSEKGGALSSDGVPVTVSLVNGQYVGMAGNTTVFTISLANDGTYTFVQKAPLDHADGSNPNDIINLTFGYTAKDADGDSSSSTITIHVKDDAPIAVADTNNVPNNASTATGNVITNDHLSVDKPNTLQSASFGGTTKSFATDGQTDANGKYVLINGQYGQLKIYDNGQYTYTYDNAHNTGNHTETFGYTLKDYDGDTSATTLTLNITDNGTGVAPSVEKTVDETTDLGKSVSDTISVTGATSFALGTSTGALGFTATGSEKGGALTSLGVPVTVSLVNGQYVGVASGKTVFTLSIANDGTYNFVQKAPLDHADGSNPNDIINLNFAYTAKDGDGDASSSTITIHVKDDAPVAYADTNATHSGAVATGNVLTNDTLSHDTPNTLQSVGEHNITKSFANPDGSDATGKFVTVNGDYGTLKIYEDGHYSYAAKDETPGTGGVKADVFAYSMKDGDGDSSATTLTITTTLPKLIVGTNVDDSGSSSTGYHVGTGHGSIGGDTANDLLIGDIGGATMTMGTKDYNIALCLDTSGSMHDDNKIGLLQEAVVNLLKSFHDYTNGEVLVDIISFSSGLKDAESFNVSTDAGYQAAVNFVNGFDTGGNTNYEAPLQEADKWFDGTSTHSAQPIAGGEDFTYFVSDGMPNSYIDNQGHLVTGDTTAANTQRAMDEITGVTDHTNEVAITQGYGQVVGVGIGVDSNTIQNLDVIDSHHNALDVQDPNDLSASLQGASPLNNLANVGADALTGGDGNDVIYGDTLNTDALAKAQGLTSFAPGSGYAVFDELQAHHGWTQDQTVNYILSHQQELAYESLDSNGDHRVGGNDTINGGAGNDIIFAQEGDDKVNAGDGDDVISGGSGHNTITGGTGADTFLFLKGASHGVDTITDYHKAENDKLDISDLLSGSGYKAGTSDVNSFVKIDHTSGDVFVDATGKGSFTTANHVATISNISTVDTVNIVFNHDEGTKIVHTV